MSDNQTTIQEDVARLLCKLDNSVERAQWHDPNDYLRPLLNQIQLLYAQIADADRRVECEQERVDEQIARLPICLPAHEGASFEERPPPDQPVARVLWDVFSRIKRLSWLELEYDGGGWVAQHSTGVYSHYDPEDGCLMTDWKDWTERGLDPCKSIWDEDK